MNESELASKAFSECRSSTAVLSTITDCHLSLRVVQNFYTSQSLGGSIDPPAPLNDGPDCATWGYCRSLMMWFHVQWNKINVGDCCRSAAARNCLISLNMRPQLKTRRSEDRLFLNNSGNLEAIRTKFYTETLTETGRSYKLAASTLQRSVFLLVWQSVCTSICLCLLVSVYFWLVCVFVWL